MFTCSKFLSKMCMNYFSPLNSEVRGRSNLLEDSSKFDPFYIKWKKGDKLMGILLS